MSEEGRERFLTSLGFFRDKMCSKEYTTAQKDSYYENLCQDYFRCDFAEELNIHFMAVTKEWERRRGYEYLKLLICASESEMIGWARNENPSQ